MTVREESFGRNRDEREDYHNLKEDVEALRRDLAKLSGNVLKEARASAEDVLGTVNEKSHKAVHQAEEKIGERPFLSILVSFVLGLVLAKALSTSSHR